MGREAGEEFEVDVKARLMQVSHLLQVGYLRKTGVDLFV